MGLVGNMNNNKEADITVSESFYHYNWLVRKNNVVIGEFKASEVINAYQSPLCFHVNEIKINSHELRKIANLLDELNGK